VSYHITPKPRQILGYDPDEPTVTMVVTTPAHVAGLVQLLTSKCATPAQREAAHDLVHRLNRHPTGRQALAYLHNSGGPDLLTDVEQWAVQHPSVDLTPHDSLSSALVTLRRLPRGAELLYRVNFGAWQTYGKPIKSEDTGRT
jgi:hypothetical protein